MLFAQTPSQQQQQLQPQNRQHHQHPRHLQQLQQPVVDFELDDDRSSLSLSSSPNSIQFSPAAAVAFHASSPLSTFNTIPAATGIHRPASSQEPVLAASLGDDFTLDQDYQDYQDCRDYQDYDMPTFGTGDLIMQSEPWLPHSQLAAGRSLGRIAHHRESSLSSLGSVSAGPASPFSQNTSNPHIAVTDAAGDGYTTMPSYYEDPTFQMVKPLAAGAAPPTSGGHDGLYSTGHAAYAPPDSLPAPAVAFGSLLATAHRQKATGASAAAERGLLPPSDLAAGANRSQPVSVASSVASDSPATPSLDPSEEEARRRNGEDNPSGIHERGKEEGGGSGEDLPSDEFPLLFDDDDECSRFFHDIAAFQAPPKLDRTMTDVYSDELYSPNFAITTSASSGPSGLVSASPGQDMFNQRLQAINNQHLSAAAQSPVSSAGVRERSPFRHGSPLAPVPTNDFGVSSAGGTRFSSVQQQQQKQQQQQQQQRQQQQQQRQQQQQQQRRDVQQVYRSQGGPTSQTISPKDAILEYREPNTEGDASHFSLFAQVHPQTVAQLGPPYSDMVTPVVSAAPNFGYMPPQIASSLQQLPRQYPFMAQHQSSPAVAVTPGGNSAMSMVQTAAARPAEPINTGSPQRPVNVAADGGTYTCTYHGCSLRFETPVLLQKHKREGHRQANALAGARRADGSTSPSFLNSQAGPHRCERINPSTGKPCNTVFSRPYDLTRHEDTIHNARKQKVRCSLCTEEKTFSRADALTRHFRVCHPDVEFPGKHRKRGIHTN